MKLDKKNVGKLVKRYRLERGLSQVEAAKKLKLSQAQFSLVETGQRGFSLEKFGLFMKRFGVRLEEFK